MAKEKRVGATFSRVAGSVYVCCNCGRKTRNTGKQSVGSETCGECWDLCGLENEVSDGHKTKEEAWPEARALMAECRKKGGNPQYDYVVDETSPEVMKAMNEATKPELPKLKKETLDVERELAILERGPRSFRVIECNPATCGTIKVFKVIATYTTFGAAVASIPKK